jgi:hypothetical protein
MISHINATRDVAGNNMFGLPFSKFKYDTTLLVGVEQTLTIPGKSKKWLAIFSFEPGSEVWVANNATATVPGAAFATTDSELNPVAREVAVDDVLHFITSNADARIGVVLYAI